MAIALIVTGATAAHGAHPCAEGKAVTTHAPAGGWTWRGIVSDQAVPSGATAFARDKADRYGRRAVHLFEGDSHVQERMVRAGEALVDPRGEPAACAALLLNAEDEARSQGRGLWRTRSVERADDRSLQGRTGRFGVVQGQVVSVGARKRTIYLNFGTYWREDFTVLVTRSKLRREPAVLARLEAAKGQRVRVRGWLESSGGPLIRVRNAEQIEWLDAPAAGGFAADP